jgi:LytR cell envelope-related transcriptional attenuator
LRHKRAERRVSRGPSIRSRPSLKLPAVLFGIACMILVVAAAVALFDRQGGAQTVADSGATAPITARREPIVAARPEKGTRDSGRSKPRAVAVSVMNGAGVQGLAARKSTLLRRKGFKVKGTGNVPATRDASVVFFKKGRARDARRVSRALRISAEKSNDRQVRALGQRAGIVVVLGTDAADTPSRQ